MYINNQDDLTLIASGTDRDKNKLLTKYDKLIYGFYLKKLRDPELAKDLVQEVLIKINNKLEQYNPEFPFNKWIFTITSNHLVDYHRQGRRLTNTVERSFLDSSAPQIHERYSTNSSIDSLHYKELLVRVHNKAREVLNELQYKVYELKFIEDNTYNEIEDKLNLNKKQLQTLIYNIRKKIKNSININ